MAVVVVWWYHDFIVEKRVLSLQSTACPLSQLWQLTLFMSLLLLEHCRLADCIQLYNTTLPCNLRAIQGIQIACSDNQTKTSGPDFIILYVNKGESCLSLPQLPPHQPAI